MIRFPFGHKALKYVLQFPSFLFFVKPNFFRVFSPFQVRLSFLMVGRTHEDVYFAFQI